VGEGNGRKRKRHWREKSSTMSESANNSGSSGAIVLEDLFNGARTGSHVHNPIEI